MNDVVVCPECKTKQFDISIYPGSRNRTSRCEHCGVILSFHIKIEVDGVDADIDEEDEGDAP